MFCKKGVFESFAKQNIFSREFCEIFNNTFFHITPPVAVPGKLKVEAVVRRCFCKKGVLKNFEKSHRKTPVPESHFYSLSHVTLSK